MASAYTVCSADRSFFFDFVESVQQHQRHGRNAGIAVEARCQVTVRVAHYHENGDVNGDQQPDVALEPSRITWEGSAARAATSTGVLSGGTGHPLVYAQGQCHQTQRTVSQPWQERGAAHWWSLIKVQHSTDDGQKRIDELAHWDRGPAASRHRPHWTTRQQQHGYASRQDAITTPTSCGRVRCFRSTDPGTAASWPFRRRRWSSHRPAALRRRRPGPVANRLPYRRVWKKTSPPLQHPLPSRSPTRKQLQSTSRTSFHPWAKNG